MNSPGSFRGLDFDFERGEISKDFDSSYNVESQVDYSPDDWCPFYSLVDSWSYSFIKLASEIRDDFVINLSMIDDKLSNISLIYYYVLASFKGAFTLVVSFVISFSYSQAWYKISFID